MAVNLEDQHETSTGPLDIAKNAGSDDTPPEVGLDGGSGKALDGSTPGTSGDAAEVELLHKKNPLGYTVTPPTEAEIEGGKV